MAGLRQAVRVDARPGSRPTGDRIAIAGYLGTKDRFDRAVADFSEAYAYQNQRDFEHLAEAVASGRVSALTGV